MSLKFLPVTLDLRDKYESIRQKSPIVSADYTFTNIWGWADIYGLSLAFLDDIAIIHQRKPYHCYWAPVGNWETLNFDFIKELPKREDFQEEIPFIQEIPAPCGHSSEQNKLCLHRVPDELAEKFIAHYGSQVERIEARGQWEYIYAQEDLALLAGRKYHKKKNHVMSFYKNYNKNIVPLHTQNNNSHGCIESVLRLQEEWCQWNDCDHSPSLQAENDVIFRVVGNWNKLNNLFGCSLYVDNTMVAFAIAEELTKDTLVVHFEKAKTDYRGAYQAINHALVNHFGQGYTFINREQDMDEEGLRKAKSSYHPVNFLKKSTLVFSF